MKRFQKAKYVRQASQLYMDLDWWLSELKADIEACESAGDGKRTRELAARFNWLRPIVRDLSDIAMELHAGPQP
jgi:hypothetical protein